jgi:tryptophan 2,3-dioxygenase
MELTPEILKRLQELKEKYAVMGQDMTSYLDGLLFSNYLTYWDYIKVDTLLTLQSPRTDFPDEMIFIMYHQITELYFKLSLHEMNQIGHNGRNVLPSGEDLGWKDKLELNYFIERLRRINSYFDALTKSFEIMINGMEHEQFLRFRMALLPASGFQSAQYRMIEICATDFINLIDKNERSRFTGKNTPVEEMFEHIYWKQGATELASGKKTLTLKQFEKKYSEKLIELAKEYRTKNLWAKYSALSDEEKKNPELVQQLKEFDMNVNVRWPLVHFKSAARYLQQAAGDVPATGGTNWQKYLPPRMQRRIFYPELWNKEELESWGRP